MYKFALEVCSAALLNVLNIHLMLCVHPLNVLFPYRCFFLSLAVFECLTDELHLLPLSGRTIYCGFPDDFVANEKNGKN